MTLPTTALQLRTLLHASGQLEVRLHDVPVPEPAPGEVLLRVEAAPINPSDLALLFGPADLSSVQVTGTAARPVLTARMPERLMPALAGRVDQALPLGNEGAGTVVKAGSSAAAQALLGRRVATFGGEMFTQYRCVPAHDCLPLPADASAADGASCFVNPLTALCMLQTMRLEGHSALVHTAAASNLGQMLNRVCVQDGVPLVNIVRRPEQEALLRAQGAAFVCDSSAPGFAEDLTAALVQTGATLAFDAIGGGRLATQILSAMEAAVLRRGGQYSRYGSSTHKQVYLYGMLDPSPTEIVRNVGMAWGVGGWLLTPCLQRIGAAAAQQLRARVLAELKTTFASHYTRTVSLAQALSPEAVAVYTQRATGAKFLIDPSLD